jgi:hypothetical protein
VVHARNAKRGLRTCLAQCPFLYLLLKTYYNLSQSLGLKDRDMVSAFPCFGPALYSTEKSNADKISSHLAILPLGSFKRRTLNKAERNYCITDKELLAVRYFIEYYRQYLLGRKFCVRTDHQALTWCQHFHVLVQLCILQRNQMQTKSQAI